MLEWLFGRRQKHVTPVRERKLPEVDCLYAIREGLLSDISLEFHKIENEFRDTERSRLDVARDLCNLADPSRYKKGGARTRKRREREVAAFRSETDPDYLIGSVYGFLQFHESKLPRYLARLATRDNTFELSVVGALVIPAVPGSDEILSELSEYTDEGCRQSTQNVRDTAAMICSRIDDEWARSLRKGGPVEDILIQHATAVKNARSARRKAWDQLVRDENTKHRLEFETAQRIECAALLSELPLKLCSSCSGYGHALRPVDEVVARSGSQSLDEIKKVTLCKSCNGYAATLSGVFGRYRGSEFRTAWKEFGARLAEALWEYHAASLIERQQASQRVHVDPREPVPPLPDHLQWKLRPRARSDGSTDYAWGFGSK